MRKLLARISQALRNIWVLLSGDTPEIPLTHCRTCFRAMKERRGTHAFKLLTCPSWHYAVIVVVGPDVRGDAIMMEAYPEARAQAIDPDHLVWPDGMLTIKPPPPPF